MAYSLKNLISPPDLNIDTTLAILNSQGKSPLLNDLLDIWVNKF